MADFSLLDLLCPKFRVKHLGRAGLVYTEQRRKVEIDCEFHTEPLGVHIFLTDELMWKDDILLSDEERIRVEGNLVAYHEQRGYKVTLRSE